MTTTRRRPSEPPVVDWEAASRRVGGGERDDAFLAELLSTFYADGVEHVVAVLGALDAHRRGERVVDGKAAASVVQAHAHAVKGSASNMALNAVSQVRNATGCCTSGRRRATAVVLPLRAGRCGP